MEGGTKYFMGDVPFVMDLNGTFNGTQFRVSGKGDGNAITGYMKGKFVCTSGKLPFSWAALSGTLGYGYKTFVKYPNGITNFYHDCFPGGYTQERVISFEGDGIMKTYHEITSEKGVLMNKVTVHAEGFDSSSPVVNHGLKMMMPSTEYIFPFENGVKSLANQVFPLKDGSGFLVADQMTVNRPLSKRLVKRPAYHHTNTEIKHSKESTEDADHVIQEEISESYEQCVFGVTSTSTYDDESSQEAIPWSIK